MNRNRTAPYEFVRIVVMLATLGSLSMICAYLVISSFGESFAAGVRSTAGVLLPLVVGGFIAVFNRSLFDRLSSLPAVPAFIIALIFGVLIMVLIRNLDSLRFAPISELIISGGLSALLYAPGALRGFMNASGGSDHWVAYYFGIVSGMLGYLVFMGYPFGQAA
ncbi:MAG: hypothetical protein ACE5OQ_16590 [Woeseia sp.]